MFAFAGDEKKPEMSGWICYAKCVDQSSAKATCDQHCTETSGDIVFINDNGKVTKIANQDVAKPMCGKKVKMNATMDKDSDMLAIQNVIEYRGP
jgi:hypothetical protein